MDGTNLQVRVPGRESPFFLEPGGVLGAQGRLARVMPGAGDVAIVHRPILRGVAPCGGRLLPLQMNVVPLDRELLGLRSSLKVDAVMGNSRDRDEFFRAFGALERLLPMVVVIEVLFFLRQDEEHRASRRPLDVFNRCVVDHSFADWCSTQALNDSSARFWISGFASRTAGRFAVGLRAQDRVGDHPA